jgi:hypothetical protein
VGGHEGLNVAFYCKLHKISAFNVFKIQLYQGDSLIADYSIIPTANGESS